MISHFSSRVLNHRLPVFFSALSIAGLFSAGCTSETVVARHRNPPPPRVEVVADVQPAPQNVVVVDQSPPPVAQAEVVVQIAPPPPRREVIVVRPSPQHVLIKGYWAWRGGRHVWIASHWELPPRRGAHWVEPRWEHRGSSYVFIEGSWR